MNTVERIKTLCKDRKIAVSKLEKDLGFANGYIGQLKKGVVPNDRLKKIADYFNLSLEFLTTGKEPKLSVSNTEIDADLLFMSKRLKEYALKLAEMSEEQQQAIFNIIDQFKKGDD